MTADNIVWREVTRAAPCRICDKPDWCRVSADGAVVICRRVDTGTGDHRVDRSGGDYWLYMMNGYTQSTVVAAIPTDADQHRADPHILHQVYRALLDGLDLSATHRETLHRRELADDQIDARGYRSLLSHRRVDLARMLVDRFGHEACRQVPGLYLEERDWRPYWMLAGAAGLLIPVRDRLGRIVALIVRRDDPGDGPRYTYVSSAQHRGASPGSPVHVPLHTGPTTMIRLTEGPLKGDIATALTGMLTISIPGVSAWRAALPIVRELGASTVRVALDADAPRNPNVARALDRTGSALKDAGLAVEIEAWNPAEGKGIDDLLAVGKTPAVLSGEAARVYVAGALITATSGSAQIHSAAYKNEVPAESIFRFLTGREIAAQTPAEIRWVVRPWVAEQAITEVDGKVKAAGKTTWVTYLVRSILDGVPFMDEPTTRSPVVYLTEQSPATFRVAMERAGLLDREDFIVLFWRDTAGVPWPKIVKAAVAECARRAARLLVVDTLGQFAGLKGDAENDSGDAAEAMKPLQTAAADGLAIVIVRHERKSGGDVGDSGRGSSAFAGAVDVVLSIRRPEGNHSMRPTLREIHALSRFDETPSHIVIELTADGYAALGTTADVERQEAETAIFEAMPDTPDHAVTLDEIVRSAGVKRTVAQETITDLLDQGCLQRTGTGKKGDPFRYCARTNDSPPEDDGGPEIHSAGTSTLRSGGKNSEVAPSLISENTVPNGGDPATDAAISSDGSHRWDTQSTTTSGRYVCSRCRTVSATSGRCRECGGPTADLIVLAPAVHSRGGEKRE
jgi:hypothetical protein